MPVAIDGCGVPTFALPLDRCAHLFARLPRLDGGPRVVAAMRAQPEMLRGPVAADVMFVRMASGLGRQRAGPRGCSAPVPTDGLGIAVKVEDGAFRAIRPAVAAFLQRLGIDPGELGVVTVENSRGEPVGTVRTRLKSRVPKR